MYLIFFLMVYTLLIILMIIADISFGPTVTGTMPLLKYTIHYYLYPQLKSMTGLLRA